MMVILTRHLAIRKFVYLFISVARILAGVKSKVPALDSCGSGLKTKSRHEAFICISYGELQCSQ